MKIAEWHAKNAETDRFFPKGFRNQW